MPSRGLSVLLVGFAALQSVLTSGMVRPSLGMHRTITRGFRGPMTFPPCTFFFSQHFADEGWGKNEESCSLSHARTLEKCTNV
jgi:hypothetical protein